jgi:hypothetical protein
MNNDRMLTLASVLTSLLCSLHFTDDIVRGFEHGPKNLIFVLILTFWLWATLVLARPRLRYVILLVGSLLAAAMPVLHLRTTGGEFAASSGAFVSIWVLITLGVMGSFSAILAVRGLWSLRQGESAA